MSTKTTTTARSPSGGASTDDLVGRLSEMKDDEDDE